MNNYHPIKKNKHTGRKDWIWHTAEFLKQTQRERKEIMSEINFQITNELFVERESVIGEADRVLF